MENSHYSPALSQNQQTIQASYQHIHMTEAKNISINAMHNSYQGMHNNMNLNNLITGKELAANDLSANSHELSKICIEQNQTCHINHDLSKTPVSHQNNKGKKLVNPKKQKIQSETESEDDEPLTVKLNKLGESFSRNTPITPSNIITHLTPNQQESNDLHTHSPIKAELPTPPKTPLFGDNGNKDHSHSVSARQAIFKSNEPLQDNSSKGLNNTTPKTKLKQSTTKSNNFESVGAESDDDMPLSLKIQAFKRQQSPTKTIEVKKEKLDHQVNSVAHHTNRDEHNKKKEQHLKHKEKLKKELSSQSQKSDKRSFREPSSTPSSPTKKIKSEFEGSQFSTTSTPVKTGKGKAKKEKEDEAPHVWKWWEEESREDGVKWNTLEHRGPVFAPDYVPLPSDVHFKYNGQVVRLAPEAEEVAGFYARMLEHDYVTKDKFNDNFFKDWRRVMNKTERTLITDLKKCDFTAIAEYYKIKSEERKNMSKEEKQKIKEENEAIANTYGFCILDGRPQKIGNYKIEPPGLFRGRGDHPKMGRLKKRIQPEDVIINCGKRGKIPEPPAGHKWKEVRHDNTVTWLASWTENIQQNIKYIMLNPSSKLKGEKDWMKYETARRLKTCVDKIRAQYKIDWKSKSMLDRQRGVALYFIDKLALRAGNEKDEETADTVGCCSLRVEHVKLHEKLGDDTHVIEFDFLGKDCIRYQNSVPVEPRVYKNIQLFMQNKKKDNDLFDRLTTQILNKHLNEQMEGLTAKVFRTFNASLTLQDQLNKLTESNSTEPEKLLAYNRANRAVAILCNHQRSIPKMHGKQMENLQEKVKAKNQAIAEAKAEAKDAKVQYSKNSKDPKFQVLYEKKREKYKRLKDQLLRLELQATDKEENKTIALGTSKLNYLDPRITVAWCKKHNVNVTKLYNKTQRDKFLWAIEMATPDYVF